MPGYDIDAFHTMTAALEVDGVIPPLGIAQD
jgi:hypothetical protein